MRRSKDTSAAAVGQPSVPLTMATALRPGDVSGVRFSATKLRPGYDEETVDVYLDRVVDELRRRWDILDAGAAAARARSRPRFQLTGASVAAQTFTLTKFRQGYVPDQVTALLEKAGETITLLDNQLRGYQFDG